MGTTCSKCGTETRSKVVATPLEMKYAKLMVYGKSKRVRKKAYYRLIELVGHDSEGLIRYSRVSILMSEVKKMNPQNLRVLRIDPLKL